MNFLLFELGGALLGWPLVNVLLAVLTTSLAGLAAARLAGSRPAAMRSGLLLAALLLAAAAPLASAASWYGRLGLWAAPAAESGPPRVAAASAVVVVEPKLFETSSVPPLPPAAEAWPSDPIPLRVAPSNSEAVPRSKVDSIVATADSRSVFDGLNLRLVFDMLLGTWLIGTLVGFARLAGSGLQLRRFAARCRPNASPRALSALASAAKKVGLAAPPRLATSPATSAPAAFGLLQPVVALPEGLVDELDDDELEAVFLHEAGHTAGGDAWVSLLQAVLQAAYWPLAPLHWLSAQLSAAREELCDDYVVAAQGDGRRFAEVLVRLAERAASPPPSPALALLDPGPRGLELRIRQLLRKDRIPMTTLTPAARLGLASFAAALFASAAFAQLRAAAPALDAPKAVDPFGTPNLDTNVDPSVAPPPPSKRGRMAPIPPKPAALPSAPPPLPQPLPTRAPNPFGSQPAAPGFQADPALPAVATRQAVRTPSPAEREEAEAAGRIAGLVADADFWSKEGAKTSHKFTPAEIAAVRAKGGPGADPRTLGRLRWLKLAADVDGRSKKAAVVSDEVAAEAVATAFRWLEEDAADSPAARKFNAPQGISHCTVSLRDRDVPEDALWVLLEEVGPNIPSSGLNLRWNRKTRAVDGVEHWGAVREVPAAVQAAFDRQAADSAKRRLASVPDGFTEVPNSLSVKKKAIRYLESQGAARILVEERVRLDVKNERTGDFRRLEAAAAAEEHWDLSGPTPVCVKVLNLADSAHHDPNGCFPRIAAGDPRPQVGAEAPAADAAPPAARAANHLAQNVADKRNGIIAPLDFWSKEGARKTHDFDPAEIAWLQVRGDPAGDPRVPHRLRWLKLRCDVEGNAKFAAAVPEETALEAAAAAFAWLESKSVDSSEARRFDAEQGFTHYAVTPRQMKVPSEHLWIEIEDAAPGRVACGLNLRWNTMLKQIDQAEHWGAVREVSAAFREALEKQPVDPALRLKMQIPEGSESVAHSFRTIRNVARCVGSNERAEVFVEESATLLARNVETGRERSLLLRTLRNEEWDVAASPPRVLKSTLVYSEPTTVGDEIQSVDCSVVDPKLQAASPAAPPSVPSAPRAPQDPNRPPRAVAPPAVPPRPAPSATPGVGAEADMERKIAAMIADPDFWSKEGAKTAHDLSPAEAALILWRGRAAGDTKAPGRLRFQKLLCDLEGRGRLAAEIPAETAQRASAGAFAWLETQSADSPEARKFNHKQGFTHYFVTPRAKEVPADHVWFLIEDVSPDHPSSGLNLRWNTVLNKIDKAEHWGASREVPAAVVAALEAQAADPDKPRPLALPDGYEAIPGARRVEKEATRYREFETSADVVVEERVTVVAKHSSDGRIRRFSQRTVRDEIWDLASSPPRAVRSKVVFDTGVRMEDADPAAVDPNRPESK